MRPVFFCGSTLALTCLSGVNSVEWQAYGKIDISWRGRMRHGFEVSGRSGGQAAAGGLRDFPRLTGTAGPEL